MTIANGYSYVAAGEKRDNDDAGACRQKIYGHSV